MLHFQTIFQCFMGGGCTAVIEFNFWLFSAQFRLPPVGRRVQFVRQSRGRQAGAGQRAGGREGGAAEREGAHQIGPADPLCQHAGACQPPPKKKANTQFFWIMTANVYCFFFCLQAFDYEQKKLLATKGEFTSCQPNFTW